MQFVKPKNITKKSLGVFTGVIQQINRSHADFGLVETADSLVATDGTVYIKRVASDTKESAVFGAAYPQLYVDSLKAEDGHFLVTKSAGSSLRAVSAGSRDMILWAQELLRFHGLQLNIVLPLFDSNTATSLLRKKSTLLAAEDRAVVSRHIDSLVSKPVPNAFHHPALLHGDPNFRNIAISDNNTAALLDFDHVLRGPVEWDLANVYMVCRIAGRDGLWHDFAQAYGVFDESLMQQLYPYRLLDSFMFASLHPTFEGPDGIQVRRTLLQQI